MCKGGLPVGVGNCGKSLLRQCPRVSLLNGTVMFRELGVGVFSLPLP
jgi:hypothetical protein